MREINLVTFCRSNPLKKEIMALNIRPVARRAVGNLGTKPDEIYSLFQKNPITGIARKMENAASKNEITL